MGNWVDAAQIISGFAALAAVWLSVVTARSARRVPMTDAYMGAWQSILNVLAVATERREEPPPKENADQLMRQFRAADHQLSLIEAVLRVQAYSREIRSQLNNLLLSTLYYDPLIREVGQHGQLTLELMPRKDWADCSDEEWVSVINSVPFTAMFAGQVRDLPGRPEDRGGLLRWYYPTVLRGLYGRTSVTSVSAAPQLQLAFMLNAYVDSFLLPWIHEASREALMGRIGARAYRALWRRRAKRWRHFPPWRRRPDLDESHLGLSEPDDRIMYEPISRRR